VAAEPAPIYDSAIHETVQRVDDDQPGGVEGSGGMGKWEYLDHTADVQVHTCEFCFHATRPTLYLYPFIRCTLTCQPPECLSKLPAHVIFPTITTPICRG
jgi:hypothetical protein